MADQPIIEKTKEQEAFEKKANEIDESPYSSLVQQIDAERRLALDYQQSRLDEILRRLKLYNNQKRDKDAIGDPLLFTVFNTVFASLYDDRLIVEFGGKTEGDEEVAENLNSLATYDYEVMEKDIFDYEWDWDTLFFGRGLALFTFFDRKLKTPLPEIIDPTVFLRDPRATSVNGNVMGRNAMRFGGREIALTMDEIKGIPGTESEGLLHEELTNDSLLRKARQARRQAQGFDEHHKEEAYDLGDNNEYALLEWFTYWKGQKVLVWLGNGGKKVVRYKTVKDLTGFDKFPIIDRTIYPISHDWSGVSIPDLIEDKQRARAIVTNLALKGMKYELYPMYVYNKNAIKNRNDLNFDFNKFVPSEGDPNNSIAPMNKYQSNYAMANWILETIDASAQRATATPELQQGIVSKDQRTLGELNLVASKVDTRYSLSAKVFGWSEKRFWQQWYRLYKKHFKSNIDEKVLRLQGAFGAKWRPLTRENIIAKIDPDVTIDSKILSEAKRIKERGLLGQYFSLVLQDPTANRRYAFRKLGKLNQLDKDELDRLLPPTIDERLAEDENDMLSEGKSVPVSPNDDHIVHLEIHMKAADTPATFAHIETHKMALLMKRDNPELFPQQSADQNAQGQGAQSANATDANTIQSQEGISGRNAAQIAGQMNEAVMPTEAAPLPPQ